MFTVGCTFGSLSFANVCSNMSEDLFGLCNAYCVAKACHTSDPNGSSNSCNILRDKFLQRAGYPIPCLQNPAISVTKKTNGSVYTPEADLKLVVGDGVSWNYTIKNVGNVAVTVNSVVDNVESQTGTGPNPSVTCLSELPATIQPNETLDCSASGTVQKGMYINEVTATALNPHTNSTIQAKATGSYFGIAPGIKITK